MSDITDSSFTSLKREIMKRQLDELQKHDLALPANPRQEGDPPPPDLYNMLVQWTKASKSQIDKGISNSGYLIVRAARHLRLTNFFYDLEVYGGPFGSDIDYNNAFMAFMESVAVYLRDDFQVIKAVNAYRNNDNKEAFRLLESSISNIQTLCNRRVHPNGQSSLVGPYCGAFIPKDYERNNSFIGIAFKGTGLPGEDINDIYAVTTTSSPDWLWGSQVGAGFFYPIFSSYEQYAPLTPFDIIQGAITAVARGSQSTIAHVTGHSLGAAYATLTYAELCIKGVDPKAIIGDLYAFGSPRVGFNDFASPVRDAVHSGAICKGSSWRIINNNDPVTTIPLFPLPITPDPFVHIDSACEIYPDKAPEPKPSEIDTYPEWSFNTEFSNHDPQEYYKSLVYATTGKPPIATPTQWGGLSVGYEIPKGLSFPKQVEVKCTFSSNRGRVNGTIAHESFVGEFIAGGSFATPEIEGTAYIYLNSWKDLYKERNKCVFTRTSDSSLALTLTLGNDTPVALVHLPIPSQYTGELNITAGTCNWRLRRTAKVIATERSFTEVYTRVLGELFGA